MPEFVVLEHDWPELHWDLMLESGSSLATWRLKHSPRTGLWIPAERIADHRKAYLNYEGPVSGNRGCVSRQFSGQFSPELAPADSMTLELTGCPFLAAEYRESPDTEFWRFS